MGAVPPAGLFLSGNTDGAAWSVSDEAWSIFQPPYELRDEGGEPEMGIALIPSAD